MSCNTFRSSGVCATLASQRHSSANSRYKRRQVSLVIPCSRKVSESGIKAVLCIVLFMAMSLTTPDESDCMKYLTQKL